MNTVLNRGAIPPQLRDNESAQKLQCLSLYLRWVALHDDYMKLKDSKQKQCQDRTHPGQPNKAISFFAALRWDTGLQKCAGKGTAVY